MLTTPLGVGSMRERTVMLGEDLRVDSGSGTGTRAELRVPLDRRLQQPSEGSPYSKVDTRMILTPLRHHRERNTVQHQATGRKETGLDMRDLQTRANPCNVCVITRNEVLGRRFESARRLSLLIGLPNGNSQELASYRR